MAERGRVSEESIEDLNVDGQVAIMTLAWALRRNVNERYLLSATIEICNPDAVLGPTEPLCSMEISGRFFVFFRRYALTATEGLAWFKACAQGGVELPELERPNTPLRLTRLLAEPPWPQLSSPWEQSIPGALHAPAPARRSSLIPERWHWQEDLFDGDELTAARAWLREQLEFDFSVDPEMLGAVHLVRIDPELIDVQEERLAKTDDDKFRMRVIPKFVAGSGSGFTFTLRRQRPHAEETPLSFSLAGECLIELPHAPFMFTSEVRHERRGLVWRVGPAVFLDGASFDVELVVRTREVNIPGSGGRAADSYSVPLVNDPEVVHVTHGSATGFTAAQVLAGNRARAEKRHPPYQQWFDGSADTATPVIRDLIRATRIEAWLVDPYFDETELRRFALAVGRTSARIKILTSAEGLRSNARRADQIPGSRLMTAAAQAAVASGGRSDIEIHVMTGSRPDVHDRFLRVDDALWLLGSSLNEFGSRGTMLVAVPDPDAVLPEILAAWNRAIPLGKWMADRRRRRANPWWRSWWRRRRRHHVVRLGSRKRK